MRRISLFGLLSLVILAFFTLYHSIVFSDKNLHLVFCNVGQGDGIFVRTANGVDIIIDGGPSGNKMLECLSRHMPLWDRTIEVMYLTHPDADHLTGLIDVAESYNIKYFGTSQAPKNTEVYKELMRILYEKNVTVHWVLRGDKIATKDKTTMTTFWPTPEFVNGKSEDTNDYSLLQLLSYGKFNALLTGDIPATYLNSQMPYVGSIDVFKPPHHGSKTGVDEFTFQHNIPKFAVLSYGYRNRYHHPSPEVTSILKQLGIPYKDTLKGDIEIVTDGVKWWVK